MAPTSEERREVAEQLRDWADRYPQGDFTWGVLGSVHYRIDGVDTRPSSNQEVLYMLADLIDPTCDVADCGHQDNAMANKCVTCHASAYRNTEAGRRVCMECHACTDRECGYKVVNEHE